MAAQGSGKAAKSTSRSLAALLGATGIIAAATLASRIAGFFRWFALSLWVGNGEVGNAYAAANQIPNVLFEVAAGGTLAAITVPLVAAPLAGGLMKEVNRTAAALLTWALTILIPVAALLAILAPILAQLLPVAAGSDHTLQRELVTTFLRIFALQVPLYGVSIVLTGVLQAKGRFFWPAIAPALSSLAVIMTFAIFGQMADQPLTGAPQVAILVLAWGTTLGVAAMSLPLLIPVYRSGIRLRPTWKLTVSQRRRAAQLGLAGIGILLSQQVAVLVALTLARWGGEVSTVTAFQYSQTIYFLPYAVLAVPVATSAFPKLVQAATKPQLADFNGICARTTRQVIAWALVGGALLWAVAPATEAVFALRSPVPGMAQAVAAMAPGIVGYALIFHLQRSLYALDLGRAAVGAIATGWLVVSLASLGGVKILAPQGADGPSTLLALGIGQSLGMTLAGALLLFFLVRRVGGGALAGVARAIAVLLPTAAMAAIIGNFLTNWLLAGPGLTTALVAIFVGAIPAGGFALGVLWAIRSQRM